MYRDCFNFNSRTHVECDEQSVPHFWRQGRFQLTHSRGVRLPIATVPIAAVAISTHALTWSATRQYKSFTAATKISTHALTWSATVGSTVLKQPLEISTHALTWSATL